MPVIPAKTGSAQFREQIVKEARNLWLSPPDLEVIRADKGWSTDDPDWCGEFIGLAAGRAGLVQSVRKFVTPSTYRLQSAKKWKQAERPQPDAPPVGDVRRGDIICVVTTERKPIGDHIAVVYHVQGDEIYTYEGNAKGLLPNGLNSKRRGIVRQVRRLRDVRQIIRLDKRHQK